MGVGGRAIPDAILEGESDPEKPAKLSPRVKANRNELVEALQGRITQHQRFLFKLHRAQVDALQAEIDTVEEELGKTLEPFPQAVKRLTTIPSVSDTIANVIVAEIGIDTARAVARNPARAPDPALLLVGGGGRPSPANKGRESRRDKRPPPPLAA